MLLYSVLLCTFYSGRLRLIAIIIVGGVEKPNNSNDLNKCQYSGAERKKPPAQDLEGIVLLLIYLLLIHTL